MWMHWSFNLRKVAHICRNDRQDDSTEASIETNKTFGLSNLDKSIYSAWILWNVPTHVHTTLHLQTSFDGIWRICRVSKVGKSVENRQPYPGLMKESGLNWNLRSKSSIVNVHVTSLEKIADVAPATRPCQRGGAVSDAKEVIILALSLQKTVIGM